MIGKADTVTLCQVESRAQMQRLPLTQPRNLEELTVQIPII
jgi:DNA polymerase III alpha subunit